MSVIDESNAFAAKGKVVGMATGIMLGIAFGKIVSSFVGDLVTPPIGVLVGRINFTDLAVTLTAGQD